MVRFGISKLMACELVKLENTDSPHQEFYVHQQLVDELCHPLCEDLREYWRVFDGETVGRFAEYLYQADCDFPVPIPVETMTPIGTVSDCTPRVTAANASDDNNEPSEGFLLTPLQRPTPVIAANASGDSNELCKEVPTPLRPLTPLESFKTTKFHTPTKCTPPARPETPAGHDYEAVLLAYAKLYILSYSQGIFALSDMCISRLHRELIEISSSRTDTRILENFVELLRYVYRSPRDAASPQPLQTAWAELQDLASQFCVLNIDLIEGNKEFMELLQEGGALATDIVTKTVRRLGSAEAAAAAAKTSLAKAEKAAATAEAVTVATEISLAKAKKAAAKAEAATAAAETALAYAENETITTETALAAATAEAARAKAKLAKARQQTNVHHGGTGDIGGSGSINPNSSPTVAYYNQISTRYDDQRDVHRIDRHHRGD